MRISSAAAVGRARTPLSCVANSSAVGSAHRRSSLYAASYSVGPCAREMSRAPSDTACDIAHADFFIGPSCVSLTTLQRFERGFIEEGT